MKVTGQCHCGQITYEAEIDPSQVRICHCTDCQRLIGTAFRAAIPSLPGSFLLKSGQPKIYVKTAESGNKRAHAFCPNCGSPIYAAAPGPIPRPTAYASARSINEQLCLRRGGKSGAALRCRGRWT